MRKLQLGNVARVLAEVGGIKAVALGGSRSRGQSGDGVDYDIGLYYDHSLQLPELSAAIRSLDDERRPDLLHRPGAWGPWINGGAWLQVDGIPVDLLLRDITQVEAVIDQCLQGNITLDYQCGHPFAFVNSIYAAETHFCQPLWEDPSLPLRTLKELLYSTGSYPPKMRQALIEKFMWEADFSLTCGRKPALGGETNYAMGSVFRAVCAWLQVLFAVNDRYLMNEKHALRQVGTLAWKPRAMEDRIGAVYRLLASGSPREAYAVLDALQAEVTSLIEQ